MENTIVIEIECGLVSRVYSNLDQLEVFVLDNDVYDNSDYEEYKAELREKVKDLNEHSCY